MKYDWNEFWSYGMPPAAMGLSCSPGGYWHLLAYPDGAWVVMELVRSMTADEIKKANEGLKDGAVFMSPTHETVLMKGCATGGVLGMTPLQLAQKYCVATYEAIMSVRNRLN